MNYSPFVQLRLHLFGTYNGPLTEHDTTGVILDDPTAKSLEKALAVLPAYFAYAYAAENEVEMEYLFADGYMRPKGYDLYRYLPDFDLDALAEDMRKCGYSKEEISIFATAFFKEMMPYQALFESVMLLRLFGQLRSGIVIKIPGLRDFEKALDLIPSFVDFLDGVNAEGYEHVGIPDLGKELGFYLHTMNITGYPEEMQVRFATAWIDAMEEQGKMSMTLMRLYLFGVCTSPAGYTLPLESKKDFPKAISALPAFVEYLKRYHDVRSAEDVHFVLSKTLLPEMEEAGYAEQDLRRFRLAWDTLTLRYKLSFADGLNLTLEIAEGVTVVDEQFVYNLSLQTLVDELHQQEEKDPHSAYDELNYLNELEQEISGIRRVILPSTVETIAPDTWRGFDALREFVVSKENPHFVSEDGVLFSADRKTILRFPSDKTAYGNGRTDTYTIPDSVEEIAPYCFGCTTPIRALYMGANLTKIGLEALGEPYCATFNQLYIPPTVTELDGDIFAGGVADGGKFYSVELVGGAAGSAIEPYCNQRGIPFVEVAEDEVDAFYATNRETLLSQYEARIAAEDRYCRDLTQQGYRAELAGDTLTLTALDPTCPTDVEVGLELNTVLSVSRRQKVRHVILGQGITAIGPDAFSYHYPKVERLHLGADVQRIATPLLYRNRVLSAITVDEANTAFSVADNVLYSHDRATLVKYATAKPELSFTIPAHVTRIGEDAFESVQNLQCLRVGANVLTIETHAFCNTHLRHLYVPKEVTKLPEECPFFIYPETDMPYLPNGFVVGTPAGSAMEAFCRNGDGFVPVHVVEEDEAEAFLTQPLPPIENQGDADKDPYYQRANAEAKKRYDAYWAEIDAKRNRSVTAFENDGDDLSFRSVDPDDLPF